MIDEEQNIDQSVWLKRGEPLLTPERIAKGDMRIEREINEETGELGQIRYAQAIIRNIMNWLWENDHITHDQHDAGNVFWAWRNQHRVAMGQQKAISSDLSESTGIKLRAYGYVLIAKRLSRYDYDAIDKAIETFENEFTRSFALRNMLAYQRAFKRLEDILPRVKDQISYLEGLSDQEREELSEEGLKKFLEQIRGID